MLGVPLPYPVTPVTGTSTAGYVRGRVCPTCRQIIARPTAVILPGDILLEANALTLDGRTIYLPAMETRLAWRLALRDGWHAVSDLALEMYGETGSDGVHAVRQLASRFRRRMEVVGLPLTITAQPGNGYRFTARRLDGQNES